MPCSINPNIFTSSLVKSKEEKLETQAGKMAQWIEALTFMPENSLDTQRPKTTEDKLLESVHLTSTPMLCHEC